MKWNHLPVAGGLYDQHPDLLDQFSYIFMERGKYEEEKRKEEEKEREAEARKAKARSGRRR